MTCNSSWQEIGRVNNPNDLKVEDRPDILYRVFKIKLDMIISDLKQGIPFEVLDAGLSDPVRYLKLFRDVSTYMIYGPFAQNLPA
ncbi:hypothetical protein AHAS_Ahas07G0094800 [Arachis hypogaea]